MFCKHYFLPKVKNTWSIKRYFHTFTFLDCFAFHFITLFLKGFLVLSDLFEAWFWKKKGKKNAVFLTHIGIWQMSMWLPTWKAKSLFHVSNFLLMWFFLPLQKFKTIKKNQRKIPIPKQICACYIFQRILYIFFKYICFF